MILPEPPAPTARSRAIDLVVLGILVGLLIWGLVGCAAAPSLDVRGLDASGLVELDTPEGTIVVDLSTGAVLGEGSESFTLKRWHVAFAAVSGETQYSVSAGSDEGAAISVRPFPVAAAAP
jgi:hypothetical protein